jgi:hypothetical protein
MRFAHPAVSEARTPPPPQNLAAFLRANAGFERAFIDVFYYDPRLLRKLGMMNGVFVLPDYEPGMPGAYARAFGLDREDTPWHGDLHAVRDADPVTLPWRTSVELLDLLSVRWYAIPQPSPPELVRELERKTSLPLIELGNAIVGRRPSALPRVYAVRSLRFEPDFDAALARVLDASFDPRREAVLTDPERPPGSIEPGIPGGGDDVVEIESFAPSQVTVRARCAAQCLAVLTDLHYPGWVVEVDGNERAIERVNALLRGVRLGPGEHHLVYRYAPGSFRLGLVLFGLACLTVLGVAALARRRDAHGS